MSLSTTNESERDAAAALPRGVGVALVTFFGDDGAPDPSATARRAHACVERGMTSVLVAGTTGEAARLSADDRIALAGAVQDAVGEVAVLVGTGCPLEDAALETTSKVATAGVADALLVFAPAASDVRAFFGRVQHEAGGVPVIAYHNPQLPSAALDPALVSELGLAIKDSSASTNRLAELVELGVQVYVGSPTQLTVAGGCGARGALLAVANVAPRLCLAAWRGDLAAQRALFSLHVRSTASFPGFLKSSEPDSI